MESKPIKHKHRKAWNEFGHSHFLTFSTYQRHQYLLDERICDLLADRITRACLELDYAVLAYVFMPDHVHLLVHPLNESYDISKFLQKIKQGPSRIAKNRGWIDTDLWEPGGGFDRNVFTPKVRQNTIDYIHQNPVRKGLVEEAWAYRWSSANWYLTGKEGLVPCCHFPSLLD